jgi:hypothetical protein
VNGNSLCKIWASSWLKLLCVTPETIIIVDL